MRACDRAGACGRFVEPPPPPARPAGRHSGRCSKQSTFTLLAVHLRRRAVALGGATTLAVTLSATARGQSARPDSVRGHARDGVSAWTALVRPTSPLADRFRVAQLQGDTTLLDSYVLRSSSLLTERDAGAPGSSVRIIAPDILFTYNGQVPYSRNEESLWSGVRQNARVGAGVDVRVGRFRLVVAPEMTYAINRPFDLDRGNRFFALGQQPGRASWGFANPWYTRPYSADVPYRFGPHALVMLNAGQSGLWYNFGPVEFGATTENMWWGPGVQNAIVMSDNAAGVPRLELRMPHPWRTRAGALDARWFTGALSESGYFDLDSTNNTRSLAAAVVTFRPAIQPLLTLGVERAVFGTASGYGETAARWLDVFRDVGHPADRALNDSSLTPGGRDQLVGLFARWLMPADGVEIYTEWVRQDFPKSLKDFLVAPTHSHGYTVGLQWLSPTATTTGGMRVQGEVTTVEQSSSFRDRPVGVFYTSRRVIQGYTQRGKVIGASVGPGSSGQWLAFDRVTPTWFAGVTFNRIRWNEDVRSTYAWPAYLGYCNHDVSLIPGVRYGRSALGGAFQADVMVNDRHNAFFQNAGGCEAGPAGKVDFTSPVVRMTFSPAHW